MSVKEIKQYEYKCDICGRIRHSNQLPSGWYQLNVSIHRQDTDPLYHDNFLVSRDSVRYVEKTLHVCPDCGSTRITLVPSEMEMAVK